MGSSPTRRKSSLLKTVFGAVFGLCSGAFLMYLTPLIDQVIKPASPLANFEARAEGLTVNFHNLATGKNIEGWWDFGDGSPLVPLVPGKDESHVYAKPGGYTARLVVKNVLGDSNDRSVTLQLEQGSAEPPRIARLEALPIGPASLAPATFKVASDIQNAQMAVWDFAEGRPLEVSSSPGKQERLVTFEKPGQHVIRLAAFNGSQQEQKTVVVNVLPAPAGSLVAVLRVTDQATHVETAEHPCQLCAQFRRDTRDKVVPFVARVPLSPGWAISDIRVSLAKNEWASLRGQKAISLDAGKLGRKDLRNLQVTLDPDGRGASLRGEFLNSGAVLPPALVLDAVVREERRGRPAPRRAAPVMSALSVPGSTPLLLPPMPRGWQTARRDVTLELREGNRVVWKEGPLPSGGGAVVNLGGRRCVLSAAQGDGRITVSVTELKPARR